MINKLYLVHQVNQAWMLNCNIYGVVDIFYLILVHEFKDDVKIIHISMFVKFCQILGMSYQENPMNFTRISEYAIYHVKVVSLRVKCCMLSLSLSLSLSLIYDNSCCI